MSDVKEKDKRMIALIKNSKIFLSNSALTFVDSEFNLGIRIG